MARVDGNVVAIDDGVDDLVDVREIEPRIDALRVEVEAQSHQVDIAGALAIAEQAALDPVRARHQAELGGGDAGAAVVMRMERDDDAVALADVAAEPFDLVGIDIGRRRLDRRGQVEDDRMIGAVGRSTSITASQTSRLKSSSAVEKGFRAIFEMPVGLGPPGGFVAQDLGAG